MAKILKSQNIEEQQGNARVGGWGVTLFDIETSHVSH